MPLLAQMNRLRSKGLRVARTRVVCMASASSPVDNVCPFGLVRLATTALCFRRILRVGHDAQRRIQHLLTVREVPEDFDRVFMTKKRTVGEQCAKSDAGKG